MLSELAGFPQVARVFGTAEWGGGCDGVMGSCLSLALPPAHVHQRRELSGILSKPCCSKQREVFLLSFSHYFVCVMLTVFFIYLPHIKIAMNIYRCIPRDRPFCVFKNKE